MLAMAARPSAVPPSGTPAGSDELCPWVADRATSDFDFDQMRNEGPSEPSAEQQQQQQQLPGPEAGSPLDKVTSPSSLAPAQRILGYDEREDDEADGVAEVGALDSQYATERRATRRLLKGTKIWFETSLRDVVVLNSVEIGFQQVRNPEDADILWVEATNACAQSGSMQAGMKPHQKVNFFPRARHMATKCELARAVNRLSLLFPTEDFDFVPKTFALPGDEAALAKAANVATGAKKPIFVVKPDAGCGGDGIYLTQDINAVRHPTCVVQEYVGNPLLLGGLKFDLRIYVLVTSIEPLRLYVCREGLCRMAVEPYEAPSKANFHKLNMHLTNYSLNKFSSQFVENTDAFADENCSKRSITTAFQQLKAEYGDAFDAEGIWGSIESIAEIILTAITPELMLGAADHSRNGSMGNCSRCFQLFGFDILLDEDMEPHLLEINHHPSLQTDAPIDMRVKTAVLRPLVRMVAYDGRMARLVRKGRGSAAVASESVEEWEDTHRGQFGEMCDGAAYRHLAVPFLHMKDLFLEVCTVGSQTKLEMSRSRLLKLARQMGWVQCEGSIFNGSAEVDLTFMRRVKYSGSPNMSFYDFVNFLLEDVGSRMFPQDPSPFCGERLQHIVSLIVSRTPQVA